MMTEQIKEKCELLNKNRESISRQFMFENGLMSAVAGLIYTEAGREADVEKLKECRKILAKNTGAFSTFRKTIELALLSKMALSEDPEKYIADVKEVYQKIRKGKLTDNSYMILAAILICDQGKQDRADEIIARYNELMKRMEKEHPFITSSEDISYVMLLALSDRDIDSIISDMEECSSYLKRTCRIKAGDNSLQGLSEILAVTGGDIKEKCDRVVSIFNTFAAREIDFGTGIEFSSLGALAGIEADVDTLVDEIIEADNLLKENREFQERSMDRKKRLMFAALLVAKYHKNESQTASNTFISSSLEIIKEKQISTAVSVISSLASSLSSVVFELIEDKKEEEKEAETE